MSETENSDADTDARSELSALLSSASLVFVGGILSGLSGLGERVIIGRMLSPALYGEISMALAIMTLTTTVALVGFSQGVPRYMSRFDTEEDVRGVLVTGFVWAEVFGILLAAGLLVFKPLIAERLFDTRYADGLLTLFALTIPLMVGARVGIGGIRGMENTLYRTYVNDLLYPGGRLVLLAALFLAGLGPYAAGYAYLVVAVLMLVTSLYLLNRLLSIVGQFRTRSRELLKFSMPLMVSTLLTSLLLRTDTMMVGYFKTSQQVGYYSAAFPLATGMLVVLSSFGFLYLPLASRLDANGEREEVEKIYTLTTKWIFIVTFPAFLAFVAFPSDVVGIFFGHEYERAGLSLAILAVGFFTNAAAGRNRETLSALGYPRYILGANAFAFALNVVLNVFLIPRFGFVGAAVASAVANVVLNVLIYVVLRSLSGITPFSKWSLRTFTRVPLLLLPPTFLLARFVSLGPFTLPVFLVVAGLLTLAVVFATGCLQSQDEVVVEFVEETLGVTVPGVRRFIPPSSDRRHR